MDQAKGDLSWLRNLKKVTRERENYSKEAGDFRKTIYSKRDSAEKILRDILQYEVHPNELKRRSFNGLSPSPFQYSDDEKKLSEPLQKCQTQNDRSDISSPVVVTTPIANTSPNILSCLPKMPVEKEVENNATILCSTAAKTRPISLVASFCKLNSGVKNQERFVTNRMSAASGDGITSAILPKEVSQHIFGSHIESFPIHSPVSGEINSVQRVKVTSTELARIVPKSTLLDEIQLISNRSETFYTSISPRASSFVSDIESREEQRGENLKSGNANTVKRKLEFADVQVSANH